MKKAKDVLNIGCGNWLVDGAVHVDRRKHRPEIDVVHDLNVLPWPFEDESFDFIVARAILEHLDIDLLVSVGECWRILRPGGELYVKLPHWQSDIAYVDPTHRWQFSLHSCDIFDPTTRFGKRYSFYTDRKWRIVKGPRMNRARSSFHVHMVKVAPTLPSPAGGGGGSAVQNEAPVQEGDE